MRPQSTGADFIALLAGVFIVTGDITRYLSPEVPGYYSVEKTREELAEIYRRPYTPGEEPGSIARRVLEHWRDDVGERDEPVANRVVASGNLIVHRSYLPFIRKWQAQMVRVLPDTDTGSAHDFTSFAYRQTDESVLNSLLLFAHDAPPFFPSMFDRDPNAYVAHLGPSPKYWVMWSKEKLLYFDAVMNIIEWARMEGYNAPKLAWCLKRRNKHLVYLVANAHFVYKKCRSVLKWIIEPLLG